MTLAFYVGMHHPSDVHRVELACVSYGAIRKRKSDFAPPRVGWILDSWAFRVLELLGDFPDPPETYALAAARWARVGRLHAVVAQDYMCEPFMLARTGKTVAEHQRLTIERYDALSTCWRDLGEPAPLMPVLQGWTIRDYQNHLEAYGDRLALGAWVGVGSVCKRQGAVGLIEDILCAIKEVRPDLRLHGFRREGAGSGEFAGPPAALQRRLHGLVFRRPVRGPRRQRLARGRGFRRAGQRAADRPRATFPFRARMTGAAA